MPKTKRIDPKRQSEVKELRKQRQINARKLEEQKRVGEAKLNFFKHPTLGDLSEIHSSVGEAISGMVKHHQVLSRGVSEKNLPAYVDILTENLIRNYRDRKFNSCKVSKRGVEIWLHRRHSRKELTLQEVGVYIGGLVNETEISDINSLDHPWFPKHEVGEIIWRGIFDLTAAINSSENDPGVRVKIIKSVIEEGNYVEFLFELNFEKKYEVDSRFLVNPGENIDLIS